MKRLSRNDAVVAGCLAVAAGMTGLAAAAAPLYDMFCRTTGYAGTPARANAAPDEIGTSMVTVRFDSNVDPALPWSFAPAQRTVTVRVGENKLAFFHAENKSGEAVTGHAAFNVAPGRAARYFTKIECFCFKEQRLEAGESVDMPVSFFVDRAILEDRNAAGIREITLSYTFYRSAARKTASVPAGGEG